MKTVALFLLVFVSIAYGQNVNLTANMFNGRGWVKMTHSDRLFYLQALKDEITYRLLAQELSEEKLKQQWAEHATVGDYIQELDKLYEERENIDIPVTLAATYCTKKLLGTYTHDELERQLIATRQLARLWLH